MGSTWPYCSNISTTEWYETTSLVGRQILFVGIFGEQKHGRVVPTSFSEVVVSGQLRLLSGSTLEGSECTTPLAVGSVITAGR